MSSSPSGLTADGNTSAACTPRRSFRSVRPSLLDRRFPGDAWLIAEADGGTALYLGNCPLVKLHLVSFDVMALNVALQQLRWKV